MGAGGKRTEGILITVGIRDALYALQFHSPHRANQSVNMSTAQAVVTVAGVNGEPSSKLPYKISPVH